MNAQLKAILCVGICLIVCLPGRALAQRHPNHEKVTQSKSKTFDFGGSKVQAIVYVSTFVPKLHKVKLVPVGQWARRDPSIDGADPLGVIDVMPYNYVSGFTLVINGKPTEVARGLWRDCYNVSDPEFERKGNKLLVVLDGGDGLVAYEVTWTIRGSGKVTRRIEWLD